MVVWSLLTFAPAPDNRKVWKVAMETASASGRAGSRTDRAMALLDWESFKPDLILFHLVLLLVFFVWLDPASCLAGYKVRVFIWSRVRM